MVEHLERVIPATQKSGIGGPEHPMRKVTRAIAFEPGAWTKERADGVRAVFDGLAPEWQQQSR